MSLADKIREQRKISVTVGDVTFTGTRATSEEFAKYSINQVMDAEVSRAHITGWSGVKESDLIDGGGKTELPFSKSDFDLVIGDKPDWYGAIAKAVLTDAIDRITKRVDSAKN